jgi:hypothetical protein
LSSIFVTKKYQKLYWKIHTHISKSDEGRELLEHSGYVNSKSSSLFTHVSIMIAVSTWALEHSSDKRHIILPVNYINFVLGIDVVMYIIITFLCLRGVWVTHAKTFKSIDDKNLDDALVVFRNIMTSRKNTFYAALLMTWGATALFMLSFIAKFLINT